VPPRGVACGTAPSSGVLRGRAHARASRLRDRVEPPARPCRSSRGARCGTGVGRPETPGAVGVAIRGVRPSGRSALLVATACSGRCSGLDGASGRSRVLPEAARHGGCISSRPGFSNSLMREVPPYRLTTHAPGVRSARILPGPLMRAAPTDTVALDPLLRPTARAAPVGTSPSNNSPAAPLVGGGQFGTEPNVVGRPDWVQPLPHRNQMQNRCRRSSVTADPCVHGPPSASGTEQPLNSRRQFSCAHPEHLQFPGTRCYLLLERPGATFGTAQRCTSMPSGRAARACRGEVQARMGVQRHVPEVASQVAPGDRGSRRLQVAATSRYSRATRSTWQRQTEAEQGPGLKPSDRRPAGPNAAVPLHIRATSRWLVKRTLPNL